MGIQKETIKRKIEEKEESKLLKEDNKKPKAIAKPRKKYETRKVVASDEAGPITSDMVQKNKNKINNYYQRKKEKEEAEKAAKKSNLSLYHDSLNPQTEDWIREKVMTDSAEVCISYICRNSPMSEDFIIELAGLTTDVYSRSYKGLKGLEVIPYDKEECMLVGEFVLSHTSEDAKAIADFLLFNNPKTLEKLSHISTAEIMKYEKLSKGCLRNIYNAPVFKDRLDWTYISTYQKLSKEFKIKWKDYYVKSQSEGNTPIAAFGRDPYKM